MKIYTQLKKFKYIFRLIISMTNLPFYRYVETFSYFARDKYIRYINVRIIYLL